MTMDDGWPSVRIDDACFAPKRDPPSDGLWVQDKEHLAAEVACINKTQGFKFQDPRFQNVVMIVLPLESSNRSVQCQNFNF